MSYQPIYGYGNNPAVPVLNYAGTAPVCMESPCPYAQWDFTLEGSQSCAVTHSGGTIRATYNSAGSGEITANIKLRMLYTGAANINAVLSYGGGSHLYWTQAHVYTFPGAATLDLAVGGATSGTIAVPYYRYDLYIELKRWVAHLPYGAWIQIDLS